MGSINASLRLAIRIWRITTSDDTFFKLIRRGRDFFCKVIIVLSVQVSRRQKMLM